MLDKQKLKSIRSKMQKAIKENKEFEEKIRIGNRKVFDSFVQSNEYINSEIEKEFVTKQSLGKNYMQFVFYIENDSLPTLSASLGDDPKLLFRTALRRYLFSLGFKNTGYNSVRNPEPIVYTESTKGYFKNKKGFTVSCEASFDG